MYVPSQYHAPDVSWVLDVINGNPLAVLATNGRETPYATHLPVVLESKTVPEAGDLTSSILVGHMNRRNPQWQALADGMAALVVFTGPHGYVSPQVYQTTPAAPTWNFTSVHVRGTLRPVTSRSRTMEIVSSTARKLESRFGDSWDMTSSSEYFARIVHGVGAFEVTITSAQSMFKLSQEQSPEVRERVLKSFSESASTAHNRLAELMEMLAALPERHHDTII